jgi:hypothetical protein
MKVRDKFGNVGVDMRIILRWIIKGWDVVVWAEFI